MKKIYIILITWLLPIFIFAQATDAFNYQAVVRDVSGQVISNKAVSIRISLLLDRPTGVPVYSETHFAITNDFGLVNLQVGNGIPAIGEFSKINWSFNNYYIEVAMDLEGGSDFQVFGASRLLSVPYALYAKHSGNAFSGDYYDLRNRPDRLSAFINDEGFITLADLQNPDIFENGNSLRNGIPAQAWSLFGNSKSDPTKDKLGTTDSVDLVMVTNDLERLRIKANGDIDLLNSLNIGKDLTVNENVYLNTVGGSTHNYGPFTVENGSLTYLTGALNVDGNTDLNSALNVDGATTLNDLLDVDGPTTLNGLLDVDGPTTLNDLLDVDGPTTLNNLLDVDGATTLNNTLDVDGASAFHNTLGVDGNTSLGSALNVVGATTLQSTLNTTGATTLGSSLTVNGSATLNSSLAANGQVTITASLGGGDGSYAAYPLRVQGSDQGIAVKVNGTRNNGKNFITFWDDNGRQGRVEGQTASELHNSFEYIWFQTQEALQTAFQIAMVAVDIIGLDDIDASIVEGIELVDIIANWAVMSVEMDNKVGVSFESGSGDYAEWLLKATNSETFSYGDIVGVRGGKISKSMENADLYLVISMSPIVLGNMPLQEEEGLYEKVAFMGQVPVKVRGKAAIGDYILASGLNDGFGIAVHPNEMTIEQYDRIVGIAWSSSEGTGGFSYINTAIGINANDLSSVIANQQVELESMKANMNNIISYLQARDPEFNATLFETEEQGGSHAVQNVSQDDEILSKRETIDRLIELFEDNPDILQGILADARNMLDEKGIDYNLFEQTSRMVTDESYYLEVLRTNNQ